MPRSAKKSWTKVSYSVTKLGGGVTPNGVTFPGGLDMTTPSLALQPGALRNVLNYECAITGGYGRIKGYERFDGRASPTKSSSFLLIQMGAMAPRPPVGTVIIGATTGATGQLVDSSISPSYVILTNVVGIFSSSEFIYYGAFQFIGFTFPVTIILTPKQIAQYTSEAADVYRTAIGAVPGSGPILGVVGMRFSGVDQVYAFRNNVGGTATNIYVASAGGWTLIPLFNVISFTAGGGGSQPADGSTLTQGGVTATVKRVMTQTGLWSGTAAGVFVITNPSGGNFGAGAATLTGGANVTLSGIQTAIVIQPGGKYQFVKYNFSGQPTTRRIYGADGVNKCFEFDGTTYAPITTGLSPDNPKYITAHVNYLFVSQQGSALFCAPAQPFRWSAVDGAGQVAVGDTVTGMITLPGSQTTSTLAIYQLTNTSFLYGNDLNSFSLKTFNSGIGALPFSVQNMFDTFVFDNLGVITIRTTLNYGNFLPNTLTRNIFPFIQQERSKINCSVVSFDKAQYRAFFSDGYGLWLTIINQQYIGAAVVQFPNQVYCVDTTDLVNEDQAVYFGSSDGNGFVYQMDIGTSFDGQPINAFATLAWDAIKSPRMRKRFRAASVEMQGASYAEIQFGYILGYGSSQINQPTSEVTYPSNFAATSQWDLMTWDQFVWDGQSLFPTDVDVTGRAENIQVTIASGTNFIDTYNINSLIYHYSMGRGIRV